MCCYSNFQEMADIFICGCIFLLYATVSQSVSDELLCKCDGSPFSALYSSSLLRFVGALRNVCCSFILHQHSIKHLVEQNRSDDSKHTLSNFACPLLVNFSLLQPNDCTLRDHSQLAFVASITPTSRKYDLTSTSTDSTGCSMRMVNAREWALLCSMAYRPQSYCENIYQDYLGKRRTVGQAPL